MQLFAPLVHKENSKPHACKGELQRSLSLSEQSLGSYMTNDNNGNASNNLSDAGFPI